MSRQIRQQTQREAYSDRNETLRLIGFAHYRAYLHSKLWKIVKERALAINGTACRRCSAPAKMIHHASYSRESMTGEDVRALIPLCGRCATATSLRRRDDAYRRIDGTRVLHLHDTNAKLLKKVRAKQPRQTPATYCQCGRLRRKDKPRCRPCLSGRRRNKRYQMDKIRAASAEYAFGDRS